VEGSAIRDPLVLNDMPIAEDRDRAWQLLLGRGDVIAVDGSLAALNQDSVEAVMRHADVFSSERAFESLNSPIPLVPITFDPPDQTRYRRILQPFFSPRSIRPLEATLRAHVIELIEPLVERGGCDFVAEVGDLFPIQTFLAFFGLPMQDLTKLKAWKEDILSATDASGLPTGEGEPASAIELIGYLGELIQSRRGVAGDDVLSQLLCAEGDDALDDAEALGLCFLFVLAGLDTVTGSLSFGMERLARNPERRKEIVDDPGLIPAAVEELLRLDPPAPFVPRVSVIGARLGGRVLPAGTRVTSYLAVANRDESVRPHPLEIDFHRGENPHASFGLGVHRCLGSHLARLEMRIVYEEWHRRIPNYELAAGPAPRVKWPRGTLGLESLNLTFLGDHS